MDSFQIVFSVREEFMNLNQYAIVTRSDVGAISICQIMNILTSNILECLELIMITLGRY